MTLSAVYRSAQLQSVRTQLLGGYLRKWVILGVLIGIVAGVGAIAFFQAIDWATQFFLGNAAGLEPPVPRGEGETVVTDITRRWAIPLVVVVGGLLSGLIVFFIAPEAEGHGTDAAIEAFHQRGGRIRSRIPPTKLVASAITIGSGGSAGREGPTAQIAAGFGSWLGDVFDLTPEDRRIAVAVGVGAGIGAIFKAPLGGALLAAEILYLRDFELEALVPGFIASVIGYTIFASWAGWDPVFGGDLGFRFEDPSSLPWYVLLGVLAAGVGVVYVRTFYGTRDLFVRSGLPLWIRPAIGGLFVGLIALQFPEILSMGYGWVQYAVEGNTVELGARLMLVLVVLKIIATSLTVGSGGSGGVFAPGLFIGGMLGGAYWGLLHEHVPGMPAEAEPMVVVGMGALFGGIAKAPIAVMLMVAEMTGEFTMIVPTMIATSVAYLLTGNVSIYESQVATRGDSPAHRGEFTIPLIQAVSVGQAMQTEVATIGPTATVAEADELMREAAMRALPVVEDGRLVGIVSSTDTLRARADGLKLVSDVYVGDLVVAYPSDTLHTALQRLTRSAITSLPVVDRARPDELRGWVSITDIARVLDLQVSELKSRPEAVRSATDDPLRYVTVEETMSRTFTTVHQDEPLSVVAERLSRSDRYAAIVVDDDASIVGIVALPDLERAATEDVDDPPVSSIATTNVVVARVGQFVADALQQPGAEDARQLPVVTERDGRLVPVGLLTRSDVLVAYLRGRGRLAAPERASLRDRGGDTDVWSFEIPIERTDRANGITLRELALPAEAVVTAVERNGSVLVPRGQLRLLAGDRVRILSSRDHLDEVEERLHIGPVHAS